MYGVIIEKGPQNWQILQQRDGKAKVSLAGRIKVEEDVLAYEDLRLIVRVTDENTNARISEAYYVEFENLRWETEIEIPTGGPYRIETYLRFDQRRERRGDRRFHIGVGDVYLIAGQSNAVGIGKDCVNDPASLDVHMFRLNGQWDIATHPLHDSTDTIFPLSLERPHTGHSPWINFGKILSKKLGYPIGLIPGAKGSISLSHWDRNTDGRYFNNAIDIVKASDSGINGILWYQGCRDAETESASVSYFERFKAVCADFRVTYGENIPILTVQLNKVVSTKHDAMEAVGYQYAVVREAQRKAMHEIDNVYMIPSIDLRVCDGIHNSAMSNMVIGERVANIALKYIYGKQVICDAPDISNAVLEEPNAVRLTFDNVMEYIWTDCGRVDVLMFSVKDSDGRIAPCDFECPGDNSIILYFERAIKEGAVVNCDGYNDTGLMPCDLYSYLPIIPFNGICVEKR